MKKDQENLIVFGFGFTIIFSILAIHFGMKHEFGSGSFKLLLASVLLLIIAASINVRFMKPLSVIYLAAAIIYGSKVTFDITSYTLLILAGLFYIVTVLKYQWLIPIYDVWMKIAHFIGTTITTLVLTLMFYGIFGIVGIVLRLLQKDILNEKLEPNCESYWINRPKKEFVKEEYFNQY